MSTKLVYGIEGSLVMTGRPGHHSKPHTHGCKQRNYLQDGELQLSVERGPYLREPADFMRLPSNVVHWLGNRVKGVCTIFTVDCPGLQDGPLPSDSALPLFASGESDTTTGSPRNVFLDHDARPSEVKSEAVEA